MLTFIISLIIMAIIKILSFLIMLPVLKFILIAGLVIVAIYGIMKFVKWIQSR